MVLFTQLVTKTAEMAGIPAEELTISRGRKKRWQSIAAVWVANPNIFEDIFYKALAHIAFGRYPSNSAPMKPLLELVEKAILTEGDALVAWKNVKSFSKAFAKVTKHFKKGKRYSCYWIQRFGLCRLYMRTFYRDEFCEPLNLVTATYRGLKRAQAVACVKNSYDNFRKIMQMLIPNSTTWSDAQWVSEKHIFATFKAVHNIDYSKDVDEFDCLVTMIMKKFLKISYCRELFYIKEISDSMAKAIWDRDFEKDICKQFLAVSRVKPIILDGGYFFAPCSGAPAAITSSWAYKKICFWRKQKSHLLSKAVRSNLLTFAMGEHPFIVKEMQKKTDIQCI